MDQVQTNTKKNFGEIFPLEKKKKKKKKKFEIVYQYFEKNYHPKCRIKRYLECCFLLFLAFKWLHLQEISIIWVEISMELFFYNSLFFFENNLFKKKKNLLIYLQIKKKKKRMW